MLIVCDKFGTVHELGNMSYKFNEQNWLIIYVDDEDDVTMYFQEFSWLKIK